MKAATAVSVGLLALVGSSSALTPSPGSGSRAQSYRVTVEGVRVDVLVTDDRRVVPGLTAADFELRDSGVPQTIDSVSLEDVPVSVMLVLDASSSVRGVPLEHLKQAASAVVDHLRSDDRAAVMTFSGTVSLACDWTSDASSLRAAISQVEAGGATALHDATFSALMLRDPSQGRPLVLVFSDANDTSSWLPGSRVIELARRQDGVVYAVTLQNPNRPVLGYLADFTSGIQPALPNVAPGAFRDAFVERLAEESGGRVLAAENSGQIQILFETIIAEFRTRYVLTYTPRGVETTGWHPLRVTLKNRSGQVTARSGYLR